MEKNTLYTYIPTAQSRRRRRLRARFPLFARLTLHWLTGSRRARTREKVCICAVYYSRRRKVQQVRQLYTVAARTVRHFSLSHIYIG